MVSKNQPVKDDRYLLQYLLAIELYRAGLPQTQIGRRLGISNNTVNGMLKGVSRHISTRTDDVE
jgi:transposase-like protein